MLVTPAINQEMIDRYLTTFEKSYTENEQYIIHGKGLIETTWYEMWCIERRSFHFAVPGTTYGSNAWFNRQQKTKKARHNPPDKYTIRLQEVLNRFPTHGIVDSPKQFNDRYACLLTRSHVPLCVFFNYGGIPSEMRADADAYKRYSGLGWRWHKNGNYMGLQGEPSCEYYADENGFDEGVYFFSIEEVVV